MKTKFTFPFLMIFGLIAFSGCEKEEEVVAKVSGNTALLTASPWFIVKHGLSPAYDTDSDGYLEDELIEKNEPYQKDDFEVFYANGTFTEEEGALKYSPNSPQILKSGTWALIANDTKLIKSFPQRVDTFDVISLNNTSMMLQIKVRNGNDTITSTLTYRH